MFRASALAPRSSRTFANSSSLIRCDTGPAGNRAADRTPPAEALVDLGRDHRLLPNCAFRFDLGVRDVADGQPAWRARAHLRGDQSEHRISHLRNVAEPLQLEM